MSDITKNSVIINSDLTWENINPEFRNKYSDKTLSELREIEIKLLHIKLANLTKNGIKEKYTADRSPAIPVRRGQILEDMMSQINYFLYSETRNNAGNYKESDIEHYAKSNELLKNTMYLTVEPSALKKYETLATLFSDMQQDPAFESGNDLTIQVATQIIAGKNGIGIDYSKLNSESYKQWINDGKTNKTGALKAEFFNICNNDNPLALKIEVVNDRDFANTNARNKENYISKDHFSNTVNKRLEDRKVKSRTNSNNIRPF